MQLKKTGLYVSGDLPFNSTKNNMIGTTLAGFAASGWQTIVVHKQNGTYLERTP